MHILVFVAHPSAYTRRGIKCKTFWAACANLKISHIQTRLQQSLQSGMNFNKRDFRTCGRPSFCVCSSNLRGCTDLDKSRRANSLQTLSKLGRLQIWWNFSISIARAEYTPEFCCPPDLDQALQKFMKTNDRQDCSCPQPIEALLKKFSLI